MEGDLQPQSASQSTPSQVISLPSGHLNPNARPCTPTSKRPLSIACPDTPSTPLSAGHLLQWRASDLLSRLDQDALIKLTPKIAGSYCELDRTPIIRSYMNVLIILHDTQSDKRWVARIPYDQDHDQPLNQKDTDGIRSSDFLENCIHPLEFVIRNFKGFRRPRLYHFALASDTKRDKSKNPVGVDYMLLDYIEGSTMPLWTNTIPTSNQRKCILERLAGIMLDLLSRPVRKDDVSKFHGIPDYLPQTEPCNTALWLYEAIDREIRVRMQEKNVPALVNYFIMRSQAPKYVVWKYNTSSWYIAHTDLHNRNIIVDEDLKINGIIDWDYAHPVPLQKAATWPKLLEFVAGDEFPDLPHTHEPPDMTRDKEYFLTCLAEKERRLSLKDVENDSKNPNKDISNIQAPLSELIRTCSERNWFELAISREKVHHTWIETFCAKDDMNNIKAISIGLSEFLRNQRYNTSRLPVDSMALKKASNLDQLKCYNEVAAWFTWRIVHEIERHEQNLIDFAWEQYASRYIKDDYGGVGSDHTDLLNLVARPPTRITWS